MNKWISFMVFFALLILSTLILFVPSCKLSPQGIVFLHGDFASPVLLETRIQSTQTIDFVFSEALSKFSAELKEKKTGEVLDSRFIMREEDGRFMVSLQLEEGTKAGEGYELHARIFDVAGNSCDILFEFSGFNDRIPQVIINEIQKEYSKPKAEFIELYCQTSGNIGGMYVYNAGDGEALAYTFPSVEVSAGEYIVLHYRSLPDEDIVDELFALDESGGTYSHPEARDFWVAENKARLPKSDVILLKSSFMGEIIDAVMYSESGKTEWKTDALKAAARAAVEAGFYTSDLPADLPCSDKVTVTRTLSRQSDGIWFVTKTSGATPGYENCTVPY